MMVSLWLKEMLNLSVLSFQLDDGYFDTLLPVEEKG
jgi:hypothetical protein